MTRLFFDHALLAEGWRQDVVLEINAAGWIGSIRTDVQAADTDERGSVAVPGMPNVHSHAFQRAMAGLAEVRGDADDSFWTWRRVMYGFLENLQPEDLRIIAAQLYVEMLEAGFTSVAEFHYLHHGPDGQAYADIGAMSEAICAAAAETGIGMTLLPVFYANGGFGGQAANPGQRRFLNGPERFERLLVRVRELLTALPDAKLGIAPHSLRAVTPESLDRVLAMEYDGPVHIHIAEQTKEVEQCLRWSGQRPVEWLLNHADVDDGWCLIHATHMSETEGRKMARAFATAGICPITEANLGDGVFDAVAFVRAGGRIGIGSDSNVYVGVAEELRSLEYSQRLRDRGRNRISGPVESTGRTLYDMALEGGRRATRRKVGRLEVGARGDIVELDTEHPSVMCGREDGWLDGWLFAGDNRVVGNVWVGGRKVVVNGSHRANAEIRHGYKQVLRKIMAGIA